MSSLNRPPAARESPIRRRRVLHARFAPALLVVAALAWFSPADAHGEQGELVVAPQRITLNSPEASVQLLVGQRHADGRFTDRTHEAAYSVVGGVVSVDRRGRVLPVSDGMSSIVVQFGSRQARVSVEVVDLGQPPPVSFRNEVVPGLTKAGCNSGGCHGKAEGQNGFKLSVFGFDAEADHAALVKEGRGRRVHLAAPRHSLLLRKATAAIPHGGGRQIEEGSFLYRRLLRWIREGAALETMHFSPITSVSVEPPRRVLALSGKQQLRVTAVDQSGTPRDVTAEAEYITNDPTIAVVDRQGFVQSSDIPGEAAILVRYMGHVSVCRIAVPQPGITFARPPEHNFIDALVWNKLRQMGIPPSDLASDAVFLRRVYLDTIGTLPNPEVTRRFLASTDPRKRTTLIDSLLDRDEYATYWAMQWADILRVDSNALGSESAFALTRWLRRQFAENRHYDEFVRDILTARGDSRSESPAPMFMVLNKPRELGRSMSQLFLGVRIECAECHHHPFERWSQDDFYALGGFFTGLKKKKAPDGAVVFYPSRGGDLKNPRTGRTVPTAPLGGPAVEWTDATDRREALADWMTQPDNPFFARAISNRLWAHYFGRGLVEPVDDFRATNPATNEPLLDALAEHLRSVDYDLKCFTRTLLQSRVYQLSAETTPANMDDRRNFSHAVDRPLGAEVLLDAISQVTEVAEKFNGWPLGARAVELWDNRMPSYFLRIFGRPTRTTVCACERGDAPSITQALHLMNSPEIADKIQHRHGRARRLAMSRRTQSEIVDELYLATLSRFPSDSERKVLQRVSFGKREPHLAERDGTEASTPAHDPVAARRAAAEDILWVLLNSKEFLYNH